MAALGKQRKIEDTNREPIKAMTWADNLAAAAQRAGHCHAGFWMDIDIKPSQASDGLDAELDFIALRRIGQLAE